MSHSELAIAGLYDHEQETVRRAPDWGGDELFAVGPRRRVERCRRTVTVTGRPGETGLAPRPRRTRSIDERFAARPERIAAWAFGMGLLLILIAIVTAPS